MSYVSVTQCSFVRKGDPALEYKRLDQMGLFKVAMYDPADDSRMLGCVNYDSRTEFDRNFQFARMNAILLVVSLSVITILHTLSVLFLVQHCRKAIILWICRILACSCLLFNALQFIVFGGEECNGEDMKCPPGAGAIVAMFNEIPIFVMVALLILVPPPENPVFVRYTSIPKGRSMRAPSSKLTEAEKAKEKFKERVNRASACKKPRPQRLEKERQEQPQGKPNLPDEEAAIMAPPASRGRVSGNGNYQRNHGSSSSTLILEDIADEALIFEDDNNSDEDSLPPPRRQTSLKYCAPSHSHIMMMK